MSAARARLAAARVCVVTDRRLLGDAPLDVALDRVLAAAPPGRICVQLREKDLDGGALLALARRARAVTARHDAALLVNDRLDVALAADADGVHLPEAGMDVATARAIAARAGAAIVVGCSRHDVAGVVAAARAGADLVVLGPVWTTPSKPGLAIGLDAITDATAQLAAAGLAARACAIGGIEDAARAAAARDAGAALVACIRAAWRGDVATLV